MIKFLTNSFLSLTLVLYIAFSPFVIIHHDHDDCEHDNDHEHDFEVCCVCFDVYLRKNIHEPDDIKLILNETSTFFSDISNQTLYLSHKSLVALNIKLSE